MPEYKNSKIYAIKSEQANKYYIGATTKRLCQRMAQHRQNYNKYINKTIEYDSSFDILKFSDAQIQLLESFECKNKDELNNKLQTYIESYKDKIVNKAKERKPKEKKEPTEKKVKITKKKILKEIEESIKEIPQPVNSPVNEVQSESDYQTSEEKPKEEPKEENIIFMNRLQALRAGLIV
jgi:hypothetical protein